MCILISEGWSEKGDCEWFFDELFLEDNSIVDKLNVEGIWSGC